MNSITDKEKQILNSHREILWLKRQIERYEQDDKTLTDFEESTIPETATDAHVEDSIEQFKQHIDRMRTNFDMVCQFNQTKDVVAKTLQNQHFTLQALYPERSDHHNMELKKVTEERINERDELASKFVALLHNLNKKKAALVQVQRNIMRQHQLNRELTATMLKSEQARRKDSIDTDPESIALRKA
jgi:DNA repair exonuclease SbcCD ATPase subunit